VSLQEVADRLHNMPVLLASAEIGKQRAIIGECIDQIYAHRKTITAIQPTSLFEPLLLAARDRVMDAEYRSTGHDSTSLEIPPTTCACVK
jgi:hypothetical protein